MTGVLFLGSGVRSGVRFGKKADGRFRDAWIELGANYALTPDRARSVTARPGGYPERSRLRKDAAALEHVIAVFYGVGNEGALLVPDTHSLVDQPAPAAIVRSPGATTLRSSCCRRCSATIDWGRRNRFREPSILGSSAAALAYRDRHHP